MSDQLTTYTYEYVCRHNCRRVCIRTPVCSRSGNSPQYSLPESWLTQSQILIHLPAGHGTILLSTDALVKSKRAKTEYSIRRSRFAAALCLCPRKRLSLSLRLALISKKKSHLEHVSFEPRARRGKNGIT